MCSLAGSFAQYCKDCCMTLQALQYCCHCLVKLQALPCSSLIINATLGCGNVGMVLCDNAGIKVSQNGHVVCYCMYCCVILQALCDNAGVVCAIVGIVILQALLWYYRHNCGILQTLFDITGIAAWYWRHYCDVAGTVVILQTLLHDIALWYCVSCWWPAK